MALCRDGSSLLALLLASLVVKSRRVSGRRRLLRQDKAS